MSATVAVESNPGDENNTVITERIVYVFPQIELFIHIDVNPHVHVCKTNFIIK